MPVGIVLQSKTEPDMRPDPQDQDARLVVLRSDPSRKFSIRPHRTEESARKQLIAISINEFAKKKRKNKL
jgi:hypothetical protein